MNLNKNRFRDKDNTAVKYVFPLAGASISNPPAVNHSGSGTPLRGFELCELTPFQKGRDEQESGFNEAESRTTFLNQLHLLFILVEHVRRGDRPTFKRETLSSSLWSPLFPSSSPLSCDTLHCHAGESHSSCGKR